MAILENDVRIRFTIGGTSIFHLQGSDGHFGERADLVVVCYKVDERIESTSQPLRASDRASTIQRLSNRLN